MSADPRCDECNEFLDEEEIEKIEDGIALCDCCNERLLSAAAEDRRLDDPRHGQAASLNRKYG